MVENLRRAPHAGLNADDEPGIPLVDPYRSIPRRLQHHWKAIAVVATLLIGAGLGFSSAGGPQTKAASMAGPSIVTAPVPGTALSRSTNATTTTVVPAATTTTTSVATQPVA